MKLKTQMNKLESILSDLRGLSDEEVTEFCYQLAEIKPMSYEDRLAISNMALFEQYDSASKLTHETKEEFLDRFMSSDDGFLYDYMYSSAL